MKQNDENSYEYLDQPPIKHAGSNKKSMWLRDRELGRAKRTKIDICVCVRVCVSVIEKEQKERRRITKGKKGE